MTDVVIIGAGVTGLAAAHALAGVGRKVTVLESETAPGGLAASYSFPGFTIERYYHHLFAGDDDLFELLEELGLSSSISWRLASVGYRIGGRNHPLDNPFEILSFPPLSMVDKGRLGRLVLSSRKKIDLAALDHLLARDWLVGKVGEKVYQKFFVPLLRGKFGEGHSKVSAAWMASRIALRSNRSLKGEYLAYPQGGLSSVVDCLAEAIAARGGEVRFGEAAARLLVDEGRIVGVATAAAEYRAPVVIATVSPDNLLKLYPFPGRFAEDCRSILFQGTVCLTVGAKKQVLEKIYWLNLDDPSLPFGVFLEHTNFFRNPAYPPAILYAAAYTQTADDALLTLPEEEVTDRFLSAIKKTFGLSADDILWARLARCPATAVVYTVGSLGKIPSMTTPVEGLLWAGLAHAFPERSINLSVELGKKAAQAAVSLLKEAESP